MYAQKIREVIPFSRRRKIIYIWQDASMEAELTKCCNCMIFTCWFVVTTVVIGTGLLGLYAVESATGHNYLRWWGSTHYKRDWDRCCISISGDHGWSAVGLSGSELWPLGWGRPQEIKSQNGERQLQTRDVFGNGGKLRDAKEWWTLRIGLWELWISRRKLLLGKRRIKIWIFELN